VLHRAAVGAAQSGRVPETGVYYRRARLLEGSDLVARPELVGAHVARLVHGSHPEQVGIGSRAEVTSLAGGRGRQPQPERAGERCSHTPRPEVGKVVGAGQSGPLVPPIEEAG
jgi:hypothetical protein